MTRASKLRPACAVVFACAAFVAHGAESARPTLAEIMADPDWIGAAASGAYFSADGAAAYYSAKRAGSPVVDLHRVDLAHGGEQVVAGALAAQADGPPVFDATGRRAAFVRHGDVFVRDLASRRLRQITRTPQEEADPQFSADGRLLSFRVGTDWFVFDTETGLTAPAAILKTEKDPDAPAVADDLREMQLRTFSTLARMRADAETLRRHEQNETREDPTRVGAPFYLGEDVSVRATVLSPDGRWLAVVTEPKPSGKFREGQLTRYVTESGYEEFEKERARVGRGPQSPQSLLLLDLAAHRVHALSFDSLPGIDEDPLAAVRAENATRVSHGAAESVGKNATATMRRGVRIVAARGEGPADAGTIRFSRDGRALAVEVRALDNKDRWIASVDFERFVLVPQHRLTDAAWINWSFNDFGWLPDGRTLWYLSEESGFAHLYRKPLAGSARALTAGRFEVSHPALSPDGHWLYVLANQRAPYDYDVYRVPVGGGMLAPVTTLHGVERFSLDRAGRRLLLTHSSSYVPARLALAPADGSGPAREITESRTEAYRALDWIEPVVVRIPSSHVQADIYAKLYQTPGTASGGTPRAAVIFIHGSGYAQNVHQRYPYYFREQMFNDRLARAGYVVLDLDYRASAGYGREWRTAIYRQMGHPEVEDLLDAKRWLVEHAGVDPHRVGLYGGSYGGFLTLMALFRAPGEFAAGAALRPVTDWMQYNQDYTADILNDPDVDPIAYRRSSPIEFAAGLADPLLICHGVIDDNVLFEDSMRLYQRLIELHKSDFTLSPYPLDRHGFANADSWLDEYKRIERLFDQHVAPPHVGGGRS